MLVRGHLPSQQGLRRPVADELIEHFIGTRPSSTITRIKTIIKLFDNLNIAVYETIVHYNKD